MSEQCFKKLFIVRSQIHKKMSHIANDRFIDDVKDSGNYEAAVEVGFISKEESQKLKEEAWKDALTQKLREVAKGLVQYQTL